VNYTQLLAGRCKANHDLKYPFKLNCIWGRRYGTSALHGH